MALYGNAERVEAFGQRLLADSMLEERSFLTGERIWTSEVFRELQERYCDSPDESDKKFDEKLRIQLRNASSRALQLFAELYVVDLAVLGNVGAETKIAKIDALLQRCTPPLSLRGDNAPTGAAQVVDMFEHGGVLNGGQGFNTGRWRQMRYLINLGAAWCALTPTEREQRATDPLQLVAALEELTDTTEPQIMKALCYMLMPESFVPISSKKHLAWITKYFGSRIPAHLSSAPHQMQASGIREQIRQERDSDWDFYDDPDEWQATTTPTPKTGAAKAAVTETVAEPAIDEDEAERITLLELDDAAADTLLVDRVWLERLRHLLLRRHQVVFQGPPGTGKTYLARRIAAQLTGKKDRVKLVQFHPAYSYEDFFEGFRPTQDGTLRLVPGPLRTLADEALANPELSYFLIIDEMNRGNLAKIFGELYFLLEYRDETVQLMYSQEPFTLPNNLFIIATMNTADRSIALVDAAMRRRFAFVDLEPASLPTSDVLRRWSTSHGLDDTLDRLWQELNRRIRERDAQAQIGPSYLMRDELADASPAALEEIWASEIMPQLHEAFYGNKDWANQNLTLDAIRKATTTAPAPGVTAS